MASLLVEIDCPEPRVLKGRQIVSADGTSWDMDASSGVWVDPVTKTLMLLPAPISEDWATTFTGDFYRLHKSDYDLITPTAWIENERGVAGNVYLENNGSNGEIVKTIEEFDPNTPMFISAYCADFEKISERAVLVCGWGEPGDPDTISLRVRSNGSVALYRGSTFLGSGEVEDGIVPTGALKKTTNSVGAQTINLLLLPMRRREIVFVTDFGTGGRVVRPDLSGLVTTNEITPAGVFWWQVPAARASVQVSRVMFSASGVAYGRTVPLRWPYTGTVDPAWSFINRYDTLGNYSIAPWATVALLDSAGAPLDGSNAFTRTTGRIRVIMEAADNRATLGIYSTDAYVGPTVTSTADDPFDMTEHFTELELSVPEFGPTTVRLEAVGPAALEDAGLAMPDADFPRTFRVQVGEQDLIRGELAPPDVSYFGTTGRADGLIWQGADRDKELVDHHFTTARPFDGDQLTAEIIDLVVQAGFDESEVFTSTDAFTLPPGGPVTAGEWQLMPERGQSLMEWVTKLHQEYAGDWIDGWTPTLLGYKRYFRAPGDYPTTAVVNLYASHADAAAAGVAAGQRSAHVVRAGLRSSSHPPEGNQILVIGQDTQTGRAIWSQVDDAASQDPTTAPASRPSNWLGKVVTVVHENPAITTQAAADRAASFLSARLMDERVVFEIPCELLFTGDTGRLVWKGDIVRLWDLGRTLWTNVRILAIPHIKIIKVVGGGTSFTTECTYAGLRVGAGEV